METYDDDLSRFEADGAAPLPVTADQGYVEHDGAHIWYAAYGSGAPVILLHGGLGHSGNWGYQVSIRCQPFRTAAKARAVQQGNAYLSRKSSPLKQDWENLRSGDY